MWCPENVLRLYVETYKNSNSSNNSGNDYLSQLNAAESKRISMCLQAILDALEPCRMHAPNSEEPFVTLKIFRKNKKMELLLVDFTIKKPETYEEELLKLLKTTMTSTKKPRKNSKAAKSQEAFKTFYVDFFRKWGPMTMEEKAQNLVEMTGEYSATMNADDSDSIEYSKTIQDLINHTRAYITEETLKNEIAKSIHDTDLSVLTKILNKNNVNEIINNVGTTPLMYACYINNTRLIELLQLYGANSALTDIFGYTSKEYAKAGPLLFTRPSEPS
jgi:hypothetical protein